MLQSEALPAAGTERVEARPYIPVELIQRCGWFVPSLHDDALLTEVEAAAYLRLKPDTLSKWRSRAYGPAWVSTSDTRSGRVLYRVGDLLLWVRAKAGSVFNPPSRGPGRPKGSRNKSKAAAAASAQ